MQTSRMEKEVSGGSSRLLGIAPRIGAIVLAVILISFSAGTIGIIDNSEALAERVRDDDEEDRGIRDRAYRSLGVAGWLIVLSAAVLIGEAVAIVLVIVNFQRLKLALQLLELVFSFEMVLCYGATGIVCAVFAQQWGHRPAVLCYSPGDCDDDPLTATHSLATIFSFIQAAVFGFLVGMVIYVIVNSQKASRTH